VGLVGRRAGYSGPGLLGDSQELVDWVDWVGRGSRGLEWAWHGLWWGCPWLKDSGWRSATAVVQILGETGVVVILFFRYRLANRSQCQLTTAPLGYVGDV